ncbi:MAG TPA: GTP-binding protein [Pirellulales bacterium]|nr:GTP-binding protein [Pirellulales bacterium]
MLDELVERFRNRDRLALARLLTLVARGQQLDSIRRALGAIGAATTTAGVPLVVALTGSAGVGKSTLVGKLAEYVRGGGKTVAVLACDPQSPLTGGALLGDRVRMPNRPDDPGLFIRSLAAASGGQAVAEHVDLMIRLLSQFGFDVILLETVGAGQGDTAVRELADVLVLLVQPESGDELQWEKAGVLEVADVVVVHKADLPGAERMEAQVRELLSLPGCRDVAVLRVSSVRQQGFSELWSAIAASPRRRACLASDAQLLLRRAQQMRAERFQDRTQRVGGVVERWQRNELDDAQAADELLQLLGRSGSEG